MTDLLALSSGKESRPLIWCRMAEWPTAKEIDLAVFRFTNFESDHLAGIDHFSDVTATILFITYGCFHFTEEQCTLITCSELILLSVSLLVPIVIERK